MNLHFSFKDESAKTPDVERELQQHVHKLERYLSAFRPELVHLHGAINHHQREGFTISLNLRLPTGQLATQEAGHATHGAIKTAFAELISQLKRHKELIRSEHKWRRGSRPGETSSAQSQKEEQRWVSRSTEEREPQPRTDKGKRFEKPDGVQISATDFQHGSLARSDIRGYVNGNLNKLRRFVEHELSFREGNGDLQLGLVAPDEVLDEVVVRALSADDVPSGISAERWSYRLALDAIDELERTNSGIDAVRLEEPIGEPNVRGTDDDLLQYHQPGERHAREDFLPDAQATTPEDEAANMEMMEQLDQALRTVPADQRRAFVLRTIEGFSVEEVAQVVGQEPQQVLKLLTEARDQVVKKLPPSNALKSKLIQSSVA